MPHQAPASPEFNPCQAVQTRVLCRGGAHRVFRAVVVASTGLLLGGAALAQNITVSNNIFPSTAIGGMATQTVSVTLHTAVALQSITIPEEFSEYSAGTAAGCTVDGTTVNASGTVCTVSVTFKPTAPGSAASPGTARMAPLQVTDIESSKPVTYSLGLLGSATGPVVMLSPATLTRVAGAAATGFPAGDLGLGNTTSGFSGDTGPATSATFSFLNIFGIYGEPLQPMAIDSARNLFVYDQGPNVIRRIDGSTNVVTTIAGTPKSAAGETGDGGLATSATIGNVNSLILDGGDNLYFLNQGPGSDPGSVIRRVDAGTGVITAVAGQNFTTADEGGTNCPTSGAKWQSFCGDGGPASNAFFYNVLGIAMDSAGDIYVVNGIGNIRKIDATTGNVSEALVATPETGTTNNYSPIGFVMGADGNLYISELDTALNAYVIKQFNVTTSNLTVVMGAAGNQPNATTCTQQGSPATSWSFIPNTQYFESGISADGAGNIYGTTGLCSGGNSDLESASATGIFRYNISTGLAYGLTDVYQEGSGQGGNNGVYDSWLGLYQILPLFAVADSAGNVYFQTFNQIAEINGATGVVDGYTSRIDFATDAPGTQCSNLAAEISTIFCQISPIANVGNAPLDISDISLSDAADFTFLAIGDSAACSSTDTVNPGQYCNIDTEFTPVTAGTITGTIVIADNAAQGGGTQQFALIGTGVAEPEATLTAVPPAFGTYTPGLQGTESFTLANPGTGPLTVYSTSAFSVSGAFTATNSCGGSVAAGGSCTITVTFTAPATAATYTGTLTVEESASANGGVLSASLSAKSGVSAPGDALSLSSINFYGQIVGTTSGTITEEITNPAVGESGAINFTGITVSAPFALGTGTNACSTSAPLEPDSYCNVYVTFTPGAMQAYTGNLTLTSNATGSPQMVPLSGQGVIFNAVENAVQPVQTMNVYFTAYGETVDIYLLTQGSTYQEFTPDATAGSCHRGTSYNIGDSCTVNVDFSPYAPGAVSGAIVITDPNGNILAEEELPGTGTGPLVAFEPGVQSTVPAPTTESGYQAPLGVAVDVNGDVFVSDSVNNRVVEVQGGTTPVVLPATTPALNSPFGLALDGLGDVFVADTLNGRVVEWPWNAETQAYGTPTYIEGGLSEPAGVATDGYGNLYVADEGHNKVFAFPVQVGGTYGTPVALPFTGLHFPKGVFVDGNNNVFVADTGDGNIDELPWTGTGYGTQTTVVSNLIQPIAIAVDASGSIYTGDGYVGGVYQVPFNGTSYGAMNRLPFTGLMSSIAVAVDLYGDVYVCDVLNNDVQELNVENPPVLNFATTAVGNTSTDSPKSVTLTNIGNQALALDGSDGPNPTYPTDFPENTTASSLCAGGTNVNPGGSCVVSVKFTPKSQGTLSESVNITDNNYGQAGNDDEISVTGTATGTVNTAPTLSPAALDFGGVQIFTTSFPLVENVTNNTGASVTLPTISITQTGTNVFFLGTGTNPCTNGETLAVGASCNIYVTFSPTVSGQAYTGTLNVGSTSLTVALSGAGDYFISDVGNSLSGQETSVLITQAGTPSTISVLTTGVAGLDFTNAGGGTCATGTAYTAGTVCSVDVGFAPIDSGTRNGAVMLTDASGNVLGITYLQGTGNGPQIVFSPATQSSLLPASTYKATGLATDAAGDLFVVDNAGGKVIKLPKSNTGFGAPVTIATGLNEPLGVAVDGAGNVYVADYANLRIVKIPWTGSAYGTLTTVPLDASTREPRFLQVDGSGNIFFTDYAHDVVMEVPWTSSGYGTPVVLPFTNQNSVNGIAVDENGDVFVGDTYGHNVLELPRMGAGYGTQVTLVSDLENGAGAPFALALDAADNLYVGEQYTGFTGTTELLEVPNAGNGGYGTPVVVPVSNLTSIWGVALDASGNIYAADEFGDQVYKLDEADPPSLTFATTGVGSTSSDSPEVVYATNIGNENLYFNNLQYPTDFPEGTAGTAECNTEFPVVPDGSCTLTIDFTPTVSGPLSEDVNLVDNNLNGDEVKQQIAVSANGTGGTVTATLTGVNFGNVGQGQQSANMAAVFTNTSTTTAIAITGITKSGTNSSDFYSGGGANACSTSTPVAAGASCNIWFYFIPTLSGNATESATIMVTDSATNSPQTASLTGTATGTPAATLNTTALNFGGVQINTASVPLVVTVTNSGSGQLNITGESITQTDNAFALVQGNNPCSTNLLPNGVGCSFYITYNPTVSGATSTGTLVIGGVNQTVSLSGTGVSFVEPVQGATAPQLVTVNISAAGTLAAIDMESTGSKNYVFGMENSGNTCAYGTAYTVGELCEVNVFFTPLYPGDNPGAIVLTDASGNTLGETFLAGTGESAQAVFYPSTPTSPLTVTSSLENPYGLATDDAGNIYIADASTNQVLKVPYTPVNTESGIRHPALVANTFGTFGTPVSLGSEWNQPTGVAVDGAGDVFVADSQNQQVMELPWNGTGYNAAVQVYSVGESDNIPESVALDNYGNLYIGVLVPSSQAEILELPQTNAGFGAPITVASGLNTGWYQNNAYPFGLAVDTQGNVYAGIFSSKSVVEYSPTGPGTFSAGTTLPLTGIDAVMGIATDANNDLYLADAIEGQLVLVGSGVGQVTLNSVQAVGIALDQQGDLFAGLSSLAEATGKTDSVAVYPYSQPVPLDFGSTAVDTVSTDSPKTEYILNIGNTDLYFNAQDNNPVYPVNFPINNNDTNLCEEDNSVSAGSSCDVSANFDPTVSGSLSGDIVLTDNSLSRTNAQQSIPVSGTGTGAAPPTATLTGIAFGNVTEGTTSAAMTATLKNTSTTAALIISGINITGTHASDFAAATSGTGACGASLAANTSCTIHVTFSPSTQSAETATLSVNDNATGSPTTAALTGTGTAPLVPAASLSPTTLAFGNEAVNTTSAAMTTTLSNTGTGPLSISSIYLNEPNENDGVVKGPHASAITISSSPDYAATTTCGATLAAGATCTISVTFTPSTTGSLPGTLYVYDNANGSPQTAGLSGTGYTGGNYTVASPTAPQTVKPGGSAQYTINVSVTPSGDIFNNPVTLTATGLPQGATASFSPVTVTPGTSTAASMMTVSTSTNYALLAPVSGSKWPISSLALVFGGAWALFRRKHRERFARIVSMALLLGAMGAATMGLMGCGAGFAQVQPKTYTITVTGTSGAQTQTTTVTLTVE